MMALEPSLLSHICYLIHHVSITGAETVHMLKGSVHCSVIQTSNPCAKNALITVPGRNCSGFLAIFVLF